MSVCLGCRDGGRVNEGFGGWLSGVHVCILSKQARHPPGVSEYEDGKGGTNDITPYELSCVVCRGNVRYDQAQCTRG